MKRRESAYSNSPILPIPEETEEDQGLKRQLASVEAEMSRYLTGEGKYSPEEGLESRLREALNRETCKRLEKERKLRELKEILKQEKTFRHSRGNSEGEFQAITRLKARIKDITASISSENDNSDLLLTAKERLGTEVAILRERIGHLEFALSKVNKRHVAALESRDRAERVEMLGSLHFSATQQAISCENALLQAQFTRKQSYKDQLSQSTNTSLLHLSQSLLSSQCRSRQCEVALATLTQSLPVLARSVRDREKSWKAWQANLAYLER